MDRMIYHTGHYPRCLKLLPTVSDVGFLVGKKELVDQPFVTCNYSFIIKGRGWYTFKGEKRPVAAPCLLLQWPDEPMYYGPDGEWDEIYFMYGRGQLDTLRDAGVFDPSSPVRSISGFPGVKRTLDEIAELFKTKSGMFPADQLDLLCWRSISESIIARCPDTILSRPELVIRKTAEQMKAEPVADYDLSTLARQNGMALSTFRRYWKLYIGESPMRFLANLRLTYACRLLVETDLTISQIANHCRFDDPLYFSRFFKKKTGLTASEYRKNHRL